MFVGFAASSRTPRQTPRILYKPVTHNLKTEQNDIILEYNYDNYQKGNLTIFAITIFGILTAFIIKSSSLLHYGLISLLVLLLFYLIIAIFSKKGFVTQNHELYKADFLFKKLLFKRQVKYVNKSSFSILKLKKRQKTVMTAVNPDSAYSLISYDIYLLNNKHTQKQFVMSLKNELESKKATDFIAKYSKFVFEIYSPDFG
tara:strand:+ start:1012 stop:1614 length:603 start_codon:yes stop_codon:yes gene_type:complete